MRIGKIKRIVILSVAVPAVAGFVGLTLARAIGWIGWLVVVPAYVVAFPLLNVMVDELDHRLRRATRDSLWLITEEGKRWREAQERGSADFDAEWSAYVTARQRGWQECPFRDSLIRSVAGHEDIASTVFAHLNDDYERWLDAPIDFLDGRTPRACAQEEAGRVCLKQLLMRMD